MTASVRFVTFNALEDSGDVVLHSRFSHIEDARDRLVALSKHHESKHLHLAFGKAEIGRRNRAPRGRLGFLRLGAERGPRAECRCRRKTPGAAHSP